ncbi:HEAT repeat-containing protein, partial [Toxoplasma gondii p89]
VSALTRLSWISAAMGPVDTRVLLLPFLQSYQLSRRESDEILCVLAAQWRAVARGVVGVLKADEEERERRLSLLGIADASARRDESAAVTRALGEIAGALEPLAAKEEKCIRDEAVTSLLYLLRFFPDFRSQQAFAQRFLLPIASRLLHSDSGLFFSKCSAAKLVPALYAYAAPAAGQVDDGVEKEKTEQEEGRDQRPAASREASAPEEKRVESEDSDLRRPELNLDRSELRSLFEKLLTHEALLVRRDAAVEVPAFVRHWRRIRDQTRQSACSEDAAQTLEEDPQGLGDFFLPTLKKMIADTIDFLRAAAVGSLLQLALLFPSASSQTFSASAVFPLLSAAVSDPSWRVRAVVARGLAALTAAFPSQFASQFYPCLQPLLRDSALRDVRQAAIRAVGEIAEVLPADEVSEYLVPLVPQLLQENAMSPAAAAAGVLPVVAPPTLSSPLLCNSPLLAPVLEVALPVARAAGAASAQTVLASLALLLNSREESHVRMTLAQHAGEFCALVATQRPAPDCPEAVRLVEGLCSALGATAGGGDWTLRVEIIKQVVPISKAFGVDFFSKHLQSIFIEAFSDHVYDVREAAVDACPPLTTEFGVRWAVEILLPRLRQVFFVGGSGKDSRSNGLDPLASLPQGRPSSSYLERIAVLHAVPKLAGVFSASETENHLLPFLLAALKDEVPNVKFTGAEVVRVMLSSKTLPSTAYTTDEIIPALKSLANDSDVDVRFCSQLALAAARS